MENREVEVKRNADGSIESFAVTEYREGVIDQFIWGPDIHLDLRPWWRKAWDWIRGRVRLSA